ncbi:MAG: hypothetical protein JXA46_01155 [Dehalococcoidales bacterium]|nr:hypothetical protein [Dehalococcoidales bacterium]
MSVPPLNKLLRFILIAAGLIIVFSVVWTFIDSYYSNFLAWVARNNISQQTLVEQTGGTIHFVHIEFSNGGWKPVKDSLEASAIQFGLLLAVALVAATPGIKIRQRILFSLMAVAITFILQVLSIIIMARTYNNMFFIIVSDVIPPVLWALFSFKYWFGQSPVSQAVRVEKSPDENNKGSKAV